MGSRVSRSSGGAGLRSSRRVLDLVMREGSALLFAAALYFVLWGGHTANLASIDAAIWSVFLAAAACFAYVFLQGISSAFLPQRREIGPLFDTLVSLIPMLVIGYTAIEWARAGGPPDAYKLVVLLMGAIATLIDLTVFTWFSIRLNRLTPN